MREGDHCRVFVAMASLKFQVSDEASMQVAMAAELERLHIPYKREWDASPYGRLDFYCDGVAVELKIKGSRAAVQRQLEKYTKHPEIDSIVLVSTRRQLCFMPPCLNKKQIITVYAGSPF